MNTLEDLSNLLLPARCALCSRLPRPICESCWEQLSFKARDVYKGELAGVAICEYKGAIADLLNEFKERGQVRLGKLLADQILLLVEKPSVAAIAYAPSSRKNFAKRGYVPAKIIAAQIARAWRLPLLKFQLVGARMDQAELDRVQRLDNLVGSMRLRRPLLGKRVLLVDDIVTTGATLCEMARAIGEAGGHASGFITVAETLPKSLTKI